MFRKAEVIGQVEGMELAIMRNQCNDKFANS